MFFNFCTYLNIGLKKNKDEMTKMEERKEVARGENRKMKRKTKRNFFIHKLIEIISYAFES